MDSEQESSDGFLYLDARPQIEMFHLERQRKHRFNEEELDILLREVQARQPGPGYKRVAQAAWEDIATKVSSSSSGYLRTGIQCKKRYSDLMRRQPNNIKRIRRVKPNRVTKQTLRHPPGEHHDVTVKTEGFKTEFVDTELNGEGPIGPLGEFQNEVGSRFPGVALDSPRNTYLVDGEQTLDTAVWSEANGVLPPITAPTHWPLHQTNLQPRVNIVRLNLEPCSQVHTPPFTRGIRIPKFGGAQGPHADTFPVTVQPRDNAPFYENVPHLVPQSQKETVPQGNQSQANISQVNQSKAYLPQSNQPQAYVQPQVNQATVHIPQIDVQPHIHVQSPPHDLTALVQLHHRGYNMLQRELVSMRSSMETVLQPLLSSISTNLERLVNAVEHLSGVQSKPQTNGGVRDRDSSPNDLHGLRSQSI
ncbi:uncharacterized protein LOC105031634 isoform X2 [Esox lucius]|uniref:uncharacterized protein LOC105031634 isoform X2 n=1 Tax=Esox lucius TaxID=8010 RepID=UPI001476E5BF|nr:uncharacterized protein LOC105031634 isoform X2 [Esox lucius]